MGTTITNLFVIVVVGIVLEVYCMPRASHTQENSNRLAELRQIRERNRNDRIQRIKSHVQKNLRLQGKTFPGDQSSDETQTPKNDLITQRIFNSNQATPTDNLDLIRLADSEDDESAHWTSQSLYPNCLLPHRIIRYLKNDEDTRNYHHMFFNLSQIGRNPNVKYIFTNATLTLFHHEKKPISSMNEEKKLYVSVYMLKPTKFGYEKVLIDGKHFTRPHRITNADFNIEAAVRVWHNYPRRNLGIFVAVSDENDEPIQFQKVFQKMDCSKNLTMNPLPSKLASSLSQNLLDKIYQKLNEFGTSTDKESFTERGLNINHLPILDLVVKATTKRDQVESGEQESDEGESTFNSFDSESMEGFPTQSRGHYRHRPRAVLSTSTTTLKPCQVKLEKLDEINCSGNEQIDNLGADQPAMELHEDNTMNGHEKSPRSSEDTIVIIKEDFVQLMLNFLLNMN